MNCPYCSREMEKGRIRALGVSDAESATIEWFAEKEFEKKGLIASIKRESVCAMRGKNGYYPDSYYCADCGKIFGEFPVR